jgi:diadenosine tetraphosphate (Ap4A) HIT family hydrolase
MSECVFCHILDGALPSSVVYRDDVCCAFLDIQPINSGHMLVVPLEHSASLAQLDPKTGSHMFAVAQRLAAALYAAGTGGGPRCQGVNFSLADGSVAGQDVFHVHLHVIPRYAGDGRGFWFVRKHVRRPQRAELDEVAGEIRAALDDGPVGEGGAR